MGLLADLTGAPSGAGQSGVARYNPLMYKIVIVTLLVVFAGLQYRLWIGDGSLAQVHRVTKMQQSLADQNAKDASRNNAMQAEVTDLKSGALATEGRARAEMGMIKRNETFFLTLDDNKSKTAPKTGAE